MIRIDNIQFESKSSWSLRSHLMFGLPAGSVKLLKIGGIPFYVHWSFLLCGCLFAGIFGYILTQTLYLCIGYTLLILFHELGHAIAAKILGLKVYFISFVRFGGYCCFDRPQTPGSAIFAYSGGMIVQVFFLIVALVYVDLQGMPNMPATKSFTYAFIHVNIVLFLLSFTPPLRGDVSDGYIIFSVIVNRIRGRPYYSMNHPNPRIYSPDTQIHQIAEFVPSGFSTGLEILNDNKTTMEFVTKVFTQYLSMSHYDALELMLEIHNRGGLLFPLDSYKEAVSVASRITADATALGFPFICRAVDVRTTNSSVRF